MSHLRQANRARRSTLPGAEGRSAFTLPRRREAPQVKRVEQPPCSSRLVHLYSRPPSEEMQKGFVGGRSCSFPPRTCGRHPCIFGCHPDPMATPVRKPSILEMVIAGLANGRLWILEDSPIWAGRGVRQPCVVCGLKISNQQFQYDVHGPRGSLPRSLWLPPSLASGIGQAATKPRRP